MSDFRVEERRKGRSTKEIEAAGLELTTAKVTELVRREITSEADIDECQWRETRDRYWPSYIQLCIGETWLYRENLDGPIPIRSLAELRFWMIEMRRLMEESSSPHGPTFANSGLRFGIAAVNDGPRWFKHLTNRPCADLDEPTNVREAGRSIESLLDIIDSEMNGSQVTKPGTGMAAEPNLKVNVPIDANPKADQPHDIPTHAGSSVDTKNEPSEVPTANRRPFDGGSMVFHEDRVELCGIDICSGPRSKTNRRVLDLLRQKKTEEEGRAIRALQRQQARKQHWARWWCVIVRWQDSRPENCDFTGTPFRSEHPVWLGRRHCS